MILPFPRQQPSNTSSQTPDRSEAGLPPISTSPCSIAGEPVLADVNAFGETSRASYQGGETTQILRNLWLPASLALSNQSTDSPNAR
jgi:hypothetical protein